MESLVPITFRDLFKIPSELITYDCITMESDKFICVRDITPAKKGITIIDTETQETSVISRVQCESAIMNPKHRVLALRAGERIQTYNLEKKEQMKKHLMSEAIEYWTWISESKIGIVTENSVFHWSLDEEDSTPKKMFDKHGSFDGATVINYKTDSTCKWLLLIGFKRVGNFMKGVMQLFSVDKKVTQPIEGNAASFLNFRVGNRTLPLICISSKDERGGGNLFVMELPVGGEITFKQRKEPVQYPENDFPVAMEASPLYQLLFMITRGGYLYLFDVESASLIYRNRITDTPIFATCAHNNGLLGVNKKGKVLHVGVNPKTIVNYLVSISKADVAMKVTTRAGLKGGNELYQKRFEQHIRQGQIYQAVVVAAKSSVLRTPEVLARIGNLPLPQPPHNKPPLSIYFQFVIENVGKLNKYESVELAKIVLQKKGGLNYVSTLVEKDQVECSEGLGDLIRGYSPDLAMKIYFKSGSHGKIVESLVAVGDWQRVLAYIERVPDFDAPFMDLFRKLIRVKPDAAEKFAAHMYNKDNEAFDPKIVVNMFVQVNHIKEATAFLFKILKEDKEEDKDLQTLLLEINLRYSPVQVVDSILAENMYTHYDHSKIARLCERVQLYQRALENYSGIEDVKRVIVNTHFIDNEWLVDFFGDMLPEDGLACLYELMKSNMRQNLKLVVRIASKYSGDIPPEGLIKMFEQYKSYDGLYYYLFSIVKTTKDEDIVFKFIEAAVRCNQISDVERITRENDVYNGKKVKEFLKENRLQNQIPLINVCDKHDMVEELIHYLYNNKFTNYIDIYVKQRNPLKTHEVISALIDCDAPEDYMKKLLTSVGSMCPIGPLIGVVEEKNRLKLIRNWCEARVEEGNTDGSVHNALCKIYIDINNNPEEFLVKNEHYDSLEIGKYCEKRRDPHLAFIAYRRGKCDDEIIELTDKNGMFKQQARYLVGRQDEDLWMKVLIEENPNRRLLVDQVVQTALLECKNADEVSTTVHAFIVANLPKELLELLEQIVLKGNTEFKNNKSLQDLLIITAIKADKTRVMGYIKRLDKYNGPNIAKIAIKKELFEEALQVYINFKLNTKALEVLLDHIQDLERAEEFAEKVQSDECYALLGRAQLREDQTDKAITSFLKGKTTGDYREVIATARRTGHFKELIKFLHIARAADHHDSLIDTELVFSLSRVAHEDPSPNNFADLEDFISSTKHQANLQEVGDRCFDGEMYESARILYTSISNFAKLASTLVRLGKNRDAVAAAQKANSIKTWKEVLKACVEAKEFRYAQSCGLNIIIHADEIDELITFYEQKGYYDEAVQLLEKGLGLTHESQKGIPTTLGILYAKYHPNKLMDHLHRYYRRIHIPRLLNVCEQNHLWGEMRFLYTNNKNYDEAVTIMMNHSVEAWDHAVFTECIIQVINLEKYYVAIDFYLKEQPEKVNDLLHVLTMKLDHERVAKEYFDKEELPLFKKYLESVQDKNLFQVNEALNRLYIEEQDYDTLRVSIDQYQNFDQYGLARKLESHDLLEFRRISANLYRMNEKYAESIALSKKDKLYKDAMETAAESNNREIAEELLLFFVQTKLNDCFAACLYQCYHLVRPDVALELAWKNKIMDMVMPYIIQVLREYTGKVDKLTMKEKKKEELEKSQPEIREQQVPVQDAPFYTGPGGPPGPVGMGPVDPPFVSGPPGVGGPTQMESMFPPYQ